jgi:uncharacterized membrane protein YeaQ/YmgE (transglycosylase-associated protein family)
MGFIKTTLLGVGGAFVGGSVAAAIGGHDPLVLRSSGFLGAVLGSIVLLVVARMLSDHRRKRR